VFVRLHNGHPLNVHLDRNARHHCAVHLCDKSDVSADYRRPTYSAFRIARRLHVDILEHSISIYA
jgi:hypothetical protein